MISSLASSEYKINLERHPASMSVHRALVIGVFLDLSESDIAFYIVLPFSALARAVKPPQKISLHF